MRPTLSLAFALALSLSSSAVRAAAPAPVPAQVPAALVKSVDALEVRLFEHDYPHDAIDDRLTRLEKMVFGEGRTGTETHRVADLVAALPAPPSDQPASGNNQAASSPAVAQAPSAPAPIKDSSQYPHVTALEHYILGQTHESDPVNKRLAALETKAFGKPSDSTDLSERTDHLEHYVEVHFHKAPFAQNPEMDIADTTPIRYRGGAVPASYSAPAAPQSLQSSQAPPAYIPAPSTSAPMLEKIGWMEGQVYGETYNEDHLLERLKRLEQTLFPHETPASNMQLMDQVDSMMGAVQMMQHQRQTGSKPQLIASAPDAAINAYKHAPQPKDDYPEGGGSDAPDKSNSHSMAKSFAHCLNEVSNMAFGGVPGTGLNGANGAGGGYWY